MPFFRWRKAGRVIVVGLVLMTILTACNPDNNQPAAVEAGSNGGEAVVSQSPVEEKDPPTPKVLDSGSEDSQTSPLATPTDASPPTVAPETEEVEPEPTQIEEAVPSQEKVFVASDRPLEGTNPAEVNLALGQYHFVEFFAHW